MTPPDTTQSKPAEASDGTPRRGRWSSRLSARLLFLTILFVMLAEIMVFVPSVANFRLNWLTERLAAAQIAAVAAQATPGWQLPKPVHDELLKRIMVHSLAVKHANQRKLILQSGMPSRVDAHYDLRDARLLTLIMDALAVYVAPPGRYVSVIGTPEFAVDQSIEIVISEAPLRTAMIGFGLNILGLSILISVITAALVYFALNALLVRPISRLTANMVRFSSDPENEANVIAPSARRDEIGTAERELADMQRQISDLFKQKSNLAALGLAVSKINHDLRNMLANAQLISDRFSAIQDPTVQRFAPKLIASLDRAIRLCTETLKFGRAQEAPPSRTRFALRPLVQEVGDGLGLPRAGAVAWRLAIPDDLEVDADHDQLFRILTNLCRNALQAIEQAPSRAEMHEIAVHGGREGTVVTIEVRDSGPGVPEVQREHLFKAFHGSGRKGSTGLGLAIAAELVAAHGGEIALVASPRGANFRIVIPDQVVELPTSIWRRA